MYDRQVRRRRAVLLALVVCCLVLLTAYFGESSGGPLRSIQTGAMEVVAPVQEGANRALKPFRDLFGWFGDTLDAKDERDKIEAERDQLRQQVARLQVAERENAELRDMVDYARGSGLDAYEPVAARVYSRSNSSWYSTIEINKGSSDGVEKDQPVINGKGLVGKVKAVSDGNAVVMLLSDAEFGVSARAARSGQSGAVLPVAGSPGDLLFDLVPAGQEGAQGRHDRHRRHDLRPPAVAVPAGPADRRGQADRRRGGARPHDPRRRRSPTCATSTSCGC